MKLIPTLWAGAAIALLPGCIARSALDVATAPVRVASKTVDLATTSQAEADERRGREMRERDERLGKHERNWRKLDAQCDRGSEEACRKRDQLSEEIDHLRATVPAYQD